LCTGLLIETKNQINCTLITILVLTKVMKEDRK